MGPLAGFSVVELAATGPVPFCGQFLGDLGADVIVVERANGGELLRERDISGRSRCCIAIDLKAPSGHEVAKRLVHKTGVLIEGFRPGVMERLGLGLEICLDLNPGLIYGRMTGWGQDGPMADMAGHDINYISMVGALDSIGPPGQPIPLLNLVADYGGGALYLAFGVLAALVERQQSGRGQVIDTAMIDGAASLMRAFFTASALGTDVGPRGTNMLDGGASFYRTYLTGDKKWMAVGALEPQFFAALLDGLGLDPSDVRQQWDRDDWPHVADAIGAVFSTADRDTWTERFHQTDACVTPVLSREEVVTAAHGLSRELFTDASGLLGPAPAQRFSRTKLDPPRPTGAIGADTDQILEQLGYDAADRKVLRTTGVVR